MKQDMPHFSPVQRRQQVIPFVCALFLAAFLVPVAWGQTVLIDLGDNFSDMSAQNWNTVQFTQTVPDLVDDSGASTGISFAPLFWGGDFQNSANWIEDTDWVLQEAATDHFGGFSISTITFGNLDGLYKLEVVCAHPQTNHLTDIRVQDIFADQNFQNIPGVIGDDFDPKVDGRDAQNWLIWNDIEPVNGEITLSVQKLAGTNAISVSALRLVRTGDAGTSSIDLSTSATSMTVPEPGAMVQFDVQIDNTGTTDVDITSLTDSEFGNLDGQGDCSLPQTIAVSGNYTCSFMGMVSGNAGDSVSPMVSASGSGSAGAVAADDTSTVDITDVQPAASVTKFKADCGSVIEEPGGTVSIGVTVTNASVESIDVTDLFDDTHGDLNGQGTCSVPQTLGVGSSYSCIYDVSLTGVAGDSETSTTTATFDDDEANVLTADGGVTVGIIAIGTSVFADCFESGDTSGWSTTEPPLP